MSATSDKLMKRIFTICKVVLCIYPFAALFYLTSTASTTGLGYAEVLQNEPVIAVTFLSAMCQPLAAWLLNIVQKRVDDLEYTPALISLIGIFIAECLFRNMVGMVGVGLLFYFVTKSMPYSFKEEFKTADWKLTALDLTGCAVLILLGGICLFASIRLGLDLFSFTLS